MLVSRSRIDSRKKSEKELFNDRKLWNRKQKRKLLLIVIFADLEQFTAKGKSIIYTGAFVELYNSRNRGRIYEVYEKIELEKCHASIAKYLCNLNVYDIIKISLILHNAHIVPKYQIINLFYIKTILIGIHSTNCISFIS